MCVFNGLYTDALSVYADQWSSTADERDYLQLANTIYSQVLAGRQVDMWITDDDPKIGRAPAPAAPMIEEPDSDSDLSAYARVWHCFCMVLVAVSFDESDACVIRVMIMIDVASQAV